MKSSTTSIEKTTTVFFGRYIASLNHAGITLLRACGNTICLIPPILEKPNKEQDE
ncbi:MAG: hypothetical protein KGD57_04060 [Candidatus Lokiarchaeota archaeon]|nr:hypothetical protein [Candidatus Lokiarchaeota archaeon]